MVRVGPSDFEREKVTDMCSGNDNRGPFSRTSNKSLVHYGRE